MEKCGEWKVLEDKRTERGDVHGVGVERMEIFSGHWWMEMVKMVYNNFNLKIIYKL